MTAAATPKKRLPASERREQILQCAIRVFARSNYQSTRIADIAKEAGISEAMIYKHFPQKKTIFMEALSYMATNLSSFWKKAVEKEANSLSLLRNMVIEYHRLIKEHPEELKLQFVALSEVNDPDIFNLLQHGYLLVRDFLQDLIQKGIEQGVIREDINIDALTYLNIGGGALTHISALLALEKDYTEDIALAAVNHLIESIKA